MRGRKHNATGRSTGSLKVKNRHTIDGVFVAHRLSMIESPAFRSLTLVGRRMLDRLEAEHCHQGGRENGNLIVTYSDFERFGIRRKSIFDGIEELVWLGFVQVMQRGWAAAFEYRTPSIYRLTYLNTDQASSTDEWSALTENHVRDIVGNLRARRNARRSQDIEGRGDCGTKPVGADEPSGRAVYSS